MTDRERELTEELARVRAERDALMGLFVIFERFDREPHWAVDREGAWDLGSISGKFPTRDAAHAAVMAAIAEIYRKRSERDKEREVEHAEEQAIEAENRALGFEPVDDPMGRIYSASSPEDAAAARREYLGDPDHDVVTIDSEQTTMYGPKVRTIWMVRHHNLGTQRALGIDLDCWSFDEAVESARAFALTNNLAIFHVVDGGGVPVPLYPSEED